MSLLKIFALCLVIVSPGSMADEEFYFLLAEAAKERTYSKVKYDGSYHVIAYPNGDVPADTGVCTDVIVRSYRSVGIDLQKQVHEDMLQNFADYPKSWGLRKADSNIDHRRVPNLQTFFTRKGQKLPVTQKASDYRPGDIVSWQLGGKLTHIGIVVTERSADGERPLIVHNIGLGPKMEDVLFVYDITGHYRYSGH